MGCERQSLDWGALRHAEEEAGHSIDPAEFFQCEPGEAPYGNSALLEEMPPADAGPPPEGGSPAEESPWWSSPEGSVCREPERPEAERESEEIAPGGHPSCETGGSGLTTDEAFAAAFNDEFRSILHAFVEGATTGPDPLSSEAPPAAITTEGGSPGERSGEALSGERLRELFTPVQRAQIMDFICTRYIPDRLFNGDERGGATAQQRILMSAHILAEGRYRPGSFEQDVHARMCYHWAQIVEHYAGVTPSSGPNAEGVMGNFDHDGNLVLGSGGSAPGGYSGARTGDDPEHPRRLAAFPFERFREIRPGDWLWYFNANSSPSGGHSVIFSRWTSEPAFEEGVWYQDAIVFSQGSPDAGGREHEARLGDQHARVGDRPVYPIMHVSRVEEDARPAETPEELLPPATGRRERELDEGNTRTLRQMERRYGRPIDIVMLVAWIREQNEAQIVALADHLTEGQRQLLEETNQRDDLEMLVRLSERLRQWTHNAELLEENERATYGGRLDEAHREAEAELTAERTRAESDLAAIDTELQPIEDEIDRLSSLLEEIDRATATRDLWREAADRRRRSRELPPRSAERSRLERERREIIDEIEEREETRRERARERSDLDRQRRELNGRARPLRNRRQRVTERLTGAEREMPYGSVHPGRLRGEEIRGRTTGLLRNLDPQPPWGDLLQAEVPPLRTELD